ERAAQDGHGAGGVDDVLDAELLVDARLNDGGGLPALHWGQRSRQGDPGPGLEHAAACHFSLAFGAHGRIPHGWLVESTVNSVCTASAITQAALSRKTLTMQSFPDAEAASLVRGVRRMREN